MILFRDDLLINLQMKVVLSNYAEEKLCDIKTPNRWEDKNGKQKNKI
jgi:hypothetical protein